MDKQATIAKIKAAIEKKQNHCIAAEKVVHMLQAERRAQKRAPLKVIKFDAAALGVNISFCGRYDTAEREAVRVLNCLNSDLYFLQLDLQEAESVTVI